MKKCSLASALVAICFISACGLDENCERVTAKIPGYGDIEIRNDLNTGVSVFFPELIFEALIRPDKCEIFGVPSGTRSLEFTQCNFRSDDDCATFGAAVNIAVSVEAGSTDVIHVSDLF